VSGIATFDSHFAPPVLKILLEMPEEVSGIATLLLSVAIYFALVEFLLETLEEVSGIATLCF